MDTWAASDDSIKGTIFGAFASVLLSIFYSLLILYVEASFAYGYASAVDMLNPGSFWLSTARHRATLQFQQTPLARPLPYGSLPRMRRT